jgi:hypothetical protein
VSSHPRRTKHRTPRTRASCNMKKNYKGSMKRMFLKKNNRKRREVEVE